MFLPIFACIIGCGLQVSTAIEAQAQPNARSETRFTLAASDTNVTPRNPDFIALGKSVARALAAQGFEQARSADDADLVVVVDWMVSDPKVVARHAGGDVGGPAVTGSAPGRAGMPVGGTNNPGSFGFGAEGQDRGELVYTRVVTLKGVDRSAYRADPQAKPLWEMKLTSEGDTDDVPSFAPFMAAAAMPYLATNAGKVRNRVAQTEDPVKYVRGDIPAMPAKRP